LHRGYGKQKNDKTVPKRTLKKKKTRLLKTRPKEINGKTIFDEKKLPDSKQIANNNNDFIVKQINN
jgi:hypothetical protein